MASSAIEFEFKGNLAQLRRDLNEASRLAKQSAGQIQRETSGGVEGGLAGLFKRTPERRAERAFSALGTSLATGDVAQGLAVFSERLSGLGLAAGIGIGVAIGVFTKFRSDIKETEKAVEALHTELSKPISLQSALSAEGISDQLETLSKSTEEVEKKSKSFGTYLRNQLFFHGAGGTAGHQTPPEEIAIAQAAEREKQLASARADAELRSANLKLQAVTSSEKDAALAKIALDAEEKRSALLLGRRRGNALDLFKSNLAIDVEAQAARLQVEKKFPEPPPEPGPLRVDTDPVPGGRRAGIGESQALVNEIELNRQGRNSSSLRLPWHYNPDTGVSSIDEMGFKRTETMPVPQPQAEAQSIDLGSKWDNIGTGMDGIKQGIDLLNQKIDQYWS